MPVRPAVAEDAPAIVSLIRRAAPHLDTKAYANGHLPDGVVALSAELHGRLVGWLEGVVDAEYTGPGAPVPPPHGYVLAVVVDPDTRRQGVGRGLMEAFARVAREAGVRWVFLYPEEGAGAGERVEFFGACGFEAVDGPGGEHPVMGARVD
ncbi:GNAT superfamily N-acetyltransferase [Nocardiopsis arvandica]|uniref:GNAT superfamily N-acetyltransferase n=1 Tax=Nocardiopsis sinuspersici TaxID=501010 RepID=A0A7Z0BHW7_9ACTN|nr:GNAT family N-acetyltransferase [Nocardiopsis sinuspersici]NYH51466.1 GNAT superfamily N-acetyltransferase [Nocardiopsis sinuspersici]